LPVAPHPLHGPVDQPPVRVLPGTGEPDLQQHQEADGEPEKAAAAAEGPGFGQVWRQSSVLQHQVLRRWTYGTPTRQIFASEHAILIGAGIGITPFASILQSIMYKYRRRKQNCPNCNYSWCENLKDSDMKLRKVDFIWINRDQKSFEWFVSLLTKLEMDQADEEPEGRFLEMHMYMTSALSKNDMKAIGLQMALDLLAKKEKRDSITGLRTRTQPGRPDWGKVR
ncbi:unnamed protein product, partial [Tetraodon nigroviridis]